jgi:hypothetical protein
MSEWPKMIMVCAECGVLVDDDRDYGLGPAEQCPAERKCGTFPRAGGLVELPGIRDVPVLPADLGRELYEVLRDVEDEAEWARRRDAALARYVKEVGGG